jgi:hypothetical protein
MELRALCRKTGGKGGRRLSFLTGFGTYAIEPVLTAAAKCVSRRLLIRTGPSNYRIPVGDGQAVSRMSDQLRSMAESLAAPRID